MKSKLHLQAALALLMLLSFQFSFAAYSGGSIMGRVIDPDTKAPVADAAVVFENQGTQRAFTTNDSGYYYAGSLPVGIYTVTAMYMSNRSIVNSVKVGDDEQRIVDIDLKTGVGMTDIIITEDRNPLMNPVDPTKVKLDRKDFKDEPITKLADITASQSGVADINGAFYVRGAREGSLVYYIDGAPVMASADIPLCGLESYTIYTGFIPPKYGDTVGGVVVLETRNFFTATH